MSLNWDYFRTGVFSLRLWGSSSGSGSKGKASCRTFLFAMFNFVLFGMIFGIIAWKKSGLLQNSEPHHCGGCIANRLTCTPQFSRTDRILLPLKFIQFGPFETMCSPKLSSSWWSALGCLFSMKKSHQLICFSCVETKWRLLFLVLAI